MTEAVYISVRAIALTAIILVFYRWLSPMLLNPFRRWMTIPILESRFPARDIYAAVRLTATAFLQAVFFVVLLLTFHIRASIDFDLVTLVLATALGIAEMAVATLLGFAVIQAMTFIETNAARRGADWRIIARGGWIQMYFKTIDVLPVPLGALSVFGYIAFEEAIFRVIVIGVIAPISSSAALVWSTALFVVYQAFHTPGWRTAVFPMLGAIVVGIVHGILYLSVQSIVPLIVAHASFFASALWSLNAMAMNRSETGRGGGHQNSGAWH